MVGMDLQTYAINPRTNYNSSVLLSIFDNQESSVIFYNSKRTDPLKQPTMLKAKQ